MDSMQSAFPILSGCWAAHLSADGHQFVAAGGKRGAVDPSETIEQSQEPLPLALRAKLTAVNNPVSRLTTELTLRRDAPLARCSGLGYLRSSFSVFFFISVIYRLLYKILFSISHFSPTTFSKSRFLYIKLYIRNVFCSKFLYVRIYHTSNAMDIFYFYLIQCLKRKEKIEKRRENLYI
jgi:hypothetical protein